MRHFILATAALTLLAAASPAFAQMSANAPGTGGGAPTPRAPTPDIAPPALPGAGDAPALNTSAQLQKPVTGDPTTALFTAINSGDYTAAQDAISRGADPDAQDSLGETPLDLSIALNRNSITFMLLSARDEGGMPSPPVMSSIPAGHYRADHHKLHAIQARALQPSPPATLGTNPGTPNPASGFLGFGNKE